MEDINFTASCLEEAIARITQYIETRTSDIAIDLQRQLPRADVRLFNQLVNAHLAQFRESGLALVTLVSKYDAGALESSTLLALAQWT